MAPTPCTNRIATRDRPGGGPAPHYAKGGRAKKVLEGEGGKGRKRLDRPGRAKGGAAFRTKSGSVSAAGRHEAEEHGETMQGGGFPIRNASDPAAARRWINKRAHELGEPALGES